MTRTYPGVIALRDVSLDIAAGEVVGLIGENGAGKSTLMNILGGVIAPTFGAIEIGGARHDRLTVQQSFDAGIAFVHQELNAFDNLDVAANVLLGREIRSAGIGGWLGLIDRAAHGAQGAADPRPGRRAFRARHAGGAVVAGRTAAARDRQGAVDERAPGHPRRADLEPDHHRDQYACSASSRSCAPTGSACLFISHRLNEVKACADRVVVLRDGQVVGHLAKHEISHDAMIRLMIGRVAEGLV